MAESRSTAGLDPQSCKTVTYIKSNNSFFFFNCCFEFQTSTRRLKQRSKRLITSLTTVWMSGQSGFQCLHLQYCLSLKDRILTFVFNHAFSKKYRYYFCFFPQRDWHNCVFPGLLSLPDWAPWIYNWGVFIHLCIKQVWKKCAATQKHTCNLLLWHNLLKKYIIDADSMLFIWSTN